MHSLCIQLAPVSWLTQLYFYWHVLPLYTDGTSVLAYTVVLLLTCSPSVNSWHQCLGLHSCTFTDVFSLCIQLAPVSCLTQLYFYRRALPLYTVGTSVLAYTVVLLLTCTPSVYSWHQCLGLHSRTFTDMHSLCIQLAPVSWFTQLYFYWHALPLYTIGTSVLAYTVVLLLTCTASVYSWHQCLGLHSRTFTDMHSLCIQLAPVSWFTQLYVYWHALPLYTVGTSVLVYTVVLLLTCSPSVYSWHQCLGLHSRTFTDMYSLYIQFAPVSWLTQLYFYWHALPLYTVGTSVLAYTVVRLLTCTPSVYSWHQCLGLHSCTFTDMYSLCIQLAPVSWLTQLYFYWHVLPLYTDGTSVLAYTVVRLLTCSPSVYNWHQCFGLHSCTSTDMLSLCIQLTPVSWLTQLYIYWHALPLYTVDTSVLAYTVVRLLTALPLYTDGISVLAYTVVRLLTCSPSVYSWHQCLGLHSRTFTDIYSLCIQLAPVSWLTQLYFYWHVLPLYTVGTSVLAYTVVLLLTCSPSVYSWHQCFGLHSCTFTDILSLCIQLASVFWLTQLYVYWHALPLYTVGTSVLAYTVVRLLTYTPSVYSWHQCFGLHSCTFTDMLSLCIQLAPVSWLTQLYVYWHVSLCIQLAPVSCLTKVYVYWHVLPLYTVGTSVLVLHSCTFTDMYSLCIQLAPVSWLTQLYFYWHVLPLYTVGTSVLAYTVVRLLTCTPSVYSWHQCLGLHSCTFTDMFSLCIQLAPVSCLTQLYFYWHYSLCIQLAPVSWLTQLYFYWHALPLYTVGTSVLAYTVVLLLTCTPSVYSWHQCLGLHSCTFTDMHSLCIQLAPVSWFTQLYFYFHALPLYTVGTSVLAYTVVLLLTCSPSVYSWHQCLGLHSCTFTDIHSLCIQLAPVSWLTQLYFYWHALPLYTVGTSVLAYTVVRLLTCTPSVYSWHQCLGLQSCTSTDMYSVCTQLAPVSWLTQLYFYWHVLPLYTVGTSFLSYKVVLLLTCTPSVYSWHRWIRSLITAEHKAADVIKCTESCAQLRSIWDRYPVLNHFFQF